MKKDWIVVVLGLIIIVGLGISGYSRLSKKGSGTVSGATTANSPTASQVSKKDFFAEDAKVMFFYSDYCHWCQKEETEVLPELGKQGYKVKPMNVGEDQSLLTKYNIEGTPTFVASNGDRLVGFQDQPTLKAWLDQHK